MPEAAPVTIATGWVILGGGVVVVVEVGVWSGLGCCTAWGCRKVGLCRRPGQQLVSTLMSLEYVRSYHRFQRTSCYTIDGPETGMCTTSITVVELLHISDLSHFPTSAGAVRYGFSRMEAGLDTWCKSLSRICLVAYKPTEIRTACFNAGYIGPSRAKSSRPRL